MIDVVCVAVVSIAAAKLEAYSTRAISTIVATLALAEVDTLGALSNARLAFDARAVDAA